MKVYFDQRTRFRFFRARQLEVVVSVFFTELEQTIIEQYDLADSIVLERRPIVYYSGDHKREIDKNIYLRQLLKYAHVEPVASPSHALVFEHQFNEALENVAHYLTVSAAPYQSKVCNL